MPPFPAALMARYLRISILSISLSILNPLISLAGDSTGEDRPQPLEILNITPTGEDVPSGRQITFQFNRPVVPVGRMERDASEIPITITPKVKGQWRWLNTQTLACMLDAKSALTPATRYEIVVNPGITAEDGATLTAPVKHSFITERPMVLHAGVRDWDGPGMPTVYITFNQPVGKETVEEHISIDTKGEYPAKIRVKATPPSDKEQTNIYEYEAMAADSGSQAGEETDKPAESRIWVVTPEDELPLDVSVEYKVSPGLISAPGPEKGIEDRALQTLTTFPPSPLKGSSAMTIIITKY